MCMTDSASSSASRPRSDLRDQIREFILENLAQAKGISSFADDEHLMETGVIDSLDVFRLVSFLEDQLGVKVYSVRSSSLQNFYEPSRRSPGEMHWDYCFVFSVSIHEEVKESRWLYGPRYVKPSDADVEYGSAQGGLLTRLAPPPDA